MTAVQKVFFSPNMESALDKLDQALTDIVTKIAALAERHGPDAINLAGFVFQMQAAKLLLAPIPLLLIAAALFYLAYRLYPSVTKAWDSMDNAGFCLGGGGLMLSSGVASIIFAIVGAVALMDGLFNPLIWAAALDPHVAIAVKVLAKF